MEYTVQKLAKLSGVSTRTLRYYDEIGLLKPARINLSGYRIYSQTEIDTLQQILFYRELGVCLEDIKTIITSPSFDGINALREHHEKLVERKDQLELLIANVEKSIAEAEGRMTMSNNEKFQGFKQNLIDENEKRFGKEARSKYCDEAVDKSNKKLLNMTPEDYEKITQLEKAVMETLHAAFQTGDPAGELAHKAADLHRQWLSFYWDSYTKEAHGGVAQMYVDDERFKAYYDKEQPGLAEFLRDAILIYTGLR